MAHALSNALVLLSFPSCAKYFLSRDWKERYATVRWRLCTVGRAILSPASAASARAFIRVSARTARVGNTRACRVETRLDTRLDTLAPRIPSFGNQASPEVVAAVYSSTPGSFILVEIPIR